MAEYRNTDNIPYVLTNERLLPWLHRYVQPNRWVIELTGGEPALYVGIDNLCEWLSYNGYKTIIKTNGLLPIHQYNNVIRVAAFHQLNNPPKYFDKILIVDKLNSLEKVQICMQNGWDYKIIGYNAETPDVATHGFKLSAYLDPHGHPVPCKNRPIHYTEQPDKFSMEYTPLKTTLCCADCKAAIDAWRFIPDIWKS